MKKTISACREVAGGCSGMAGSATMICALTMCSVLRADIDILRFDGRKEIQPAQKQRRLYWVSLPRNAHGAGQK